MDFLCKKKRKVEEPGVYSIELHSDILSVPFTFKDNTYKAYLYYFTNFSNFGILLPITINYMLEELKLVGVRKFSYEEMQKLEGFQEVLWTDLLQKYSTGKNKENNKEDKSFITSSANYLVVPLALKSIDWKCIKIALQEISPLSLSSIRENLRHMHIYKKINSNATFYYITSTTKEKKIERVLKKLPKESMYSQNIPDEIESMIIDRVQEILVEIVKNNDISLAICRKTRVASRNPTNFLSKLKPKSLTVMNLSDLEVFYLTRKQYRNSLKLFRALISLERLSYLQKFSKKYRFKGPLSLLQTATTAPSLDLVNNYDSLENLGDSVLKTISSLYVFINNPELDEGELTNHRTKYINNNKLSQISKKNELFYYMRASFFNSKHFQPAHFTVFSPQVKLTIKERISDGMLADLVESLIGAFFLSSGFLSAAKFIEKLGIFETNPLTSIFPYLSDSYAFLYSKSDLNNFTCNAFSDLISEPVFSEDLLDTEYSQLEEKLKYTFKDKSILKEAFTHTSISKESNYEKLEFLGDSVVDIIVVSNMIKMGDFTAENLTVFRHMIVNNNILSKFSISMGLNNYLKASKEIYSEIDSYLREVVWEEDILNFGSYNSDPPKYLNDVFESLVGAVLVDCKSLDKTCEIFAPLFKKIMIWLALNKGSCDMNIRSKLSIYCQRHRLALKTQTFTSNGTNIAKIYIDDKFVCEYAARTSWHAKQKASEIAYEILNRDCI